MIKANFKAYSTYVTDSLHQWDINQVLEVTGLNLTDAPEVHFSNKNMDRAIVRQATMTDHVVRVDIPNSLLQDPLRIYAHIGVYEGYTFKVVEVVEIPVIPRKRPEDYQIEANDGEVYSFKALENALGNKATRAELTAAGANINARIDNIIAHNNDTDGNTELLDVRYGADGVTYPSAGAAVRGQVETVARGAAYTDIALRDVVKYNLFSGIYVVGQSLLYTEGDTTFSFTTSAAGVSCVLRVKPNTTYHVKKYDVSDRLRIATHPSKPVPGTEGLTMHFNWHASSEAEIGTKITTGENDHYMIVYVSSQAETPRLCVTEGFEQTGFIDYGASELHEQAEINQNRNDFARVVAQMRGLVYGNLFDGVYVEKAAILTDATASLTSADDCRSAILQIVPNTHYYVQKFSSSNRFKVATCVTYPKTGDAVTVHAESGAGTDFISGPTDNYMIVYVSNQAETPDVCVTVGRAAEGFIPYGTYISVDREKLDNLQGGEFHFLDDLRGVFACPDTVPGGAVTDAVPLTERDCSAIYDIYDALVTSYPNYVSKTVLGTVSGYAYNQYTFSWMTVQNKSTHKLKKLKIVLTAAVHGYEQGSAWGLAQFFKLLCENKNDDILTFMRRNIEFVVVPVANPYGFAHNTRKNENGVDINRNFDADWSESNPTDDYYGGAEPHSEAETQLLVDVLEANTDAKYVVDYHNIATGYPLFYLTSSDQVNLCNSVFSVLTDKWMEKYEGFPTDQLLGYCSTGSGATLTSYARKLGVTALTVETPWTMPVVGIAQYDQPTIQTGVDVLVNTLVAILKGYR